MEWGYRAAFINFKSYYTKYKLHTLNTIINRWAPANENNTSAYIQRVESLTAIDRNAKLPAPHEAFPAWLSIATAMSVVECGVCTVDMVIAAVRGWHLAFT